jgi:hypothetical protein
MAWPGAGSGVRRSRDHDALELVRGRLLLPHDLKLSEISYHDLELAGSKGRLSRLEWSGDLDHLPRKMLVRLDTQPFDRVLYFPRLS